MGQARRRRSASSVNGAAAPIPELIVAEPAPPLEVRLCVPADLPAMATRGVQYHAEAGDERLPLDLEKSLKWMYYAIEKQLAICVEQDGEPVGAMILSEDPPWWSNANALWEAG